MKGSEVGVGRRGSQRWHILAETCVKEGKSLYKGAEAEMPVCSRRNEEASDGRRMSEGKRWG